MVKQPQIFDYYQNWINFIKSCLGYIQLMTMQQEQAY